MRDTYATIVVVGILAFAYNIYGAIADQSRDRPGPRGKSLYVCREVNDQQISNVPLAVRRACSAENSPESVRY